MITSALIRKMASKVTTGLAVKSGFSAGFINPTINAGDDNNLYWLNNVENKIRDIQGDYKNRTLSQF